MRQAKYCTEKTKKIETARNGNQQVRTYEDESTSRPDFFHPSIST